MQKRCRKNLLTVSRKKLLLRRMKPAYKDFSKTF